MQRTRISCNTWLRAMTSSTEGSERVVCWSTGTFCSTSGLRVPLLPFTCLTRFVVCVRVCVCVVMLQFGRSVTLSHDRFEPSDEGRRSHPRRSPDTPTARATSSIAQPWLQATADRLPRTTFPHLPSRSCITHALGRALGRISKCSCDSDGRLPEIARTRARTRRARRSPLPTLTWWRPKI